MNGRKTLKSICLAAFLAAASHSAASAGGRIADGLVVLYDFSERSGDVVRDRFGTAGPLDLHIGKPAAVARRNGALVVQSSTTITSAGPASRVVEAVMKSGALSIEAWCRPQSEGQSGPARIVSLSSDPGNRNFTLGQEGKRIDVRLRTSATDQNGLPSTTAPDGSLRSELTHVVFTRDASGRAAIYVNGQPQVSQSVSGDLSTWSGDFRLQLANEATGDRPWLGELHLVAIYSRALSADEVAGNFAAGLKPPIDYAKLLPPAATRPVDFVKDVLPVFRERCFECHAEGNEEGGLNLGVRARVREGGSSGPVLVPGDGAASRLVHLVAAVEEDAVMPPEGDRLSPDQVGILRAWIDQGAQWPAGADVLDPRTEQARAHWAFQPLGPVEPPVIKDTRWARTPIDRFILSALKSKGLAPSATVGHGALVRRIYFDVVGLPPTPQDMETWTSRLSKSSSGAPLSAGAPPNDEAIAQLAGHLLASRHYGERWGRHWLDVARYADSDGYESDADRPHAYQYRDFVIRALNDDLPANEFLCWQLAGDEIEPDDPQAVAATGFLTAAAITILPPTHLEEERLRNRYNELDDILSTIGTGMLGLTLGCARCHDHKYDAIPSREYYRLLCAIHGGDRQVVKLAADGAEALVFRDSGGEPQPTWLFERGDFYDRDQPVRLGFLGALSRNRTAEAYWNDARRDPPRNDTTYQRKALAAWITDVDRGAGALAARVLVNRVWQHHFGEGLVRTVSDFGVQSEPPSHPELLEWLAHDFVAHGWKLKRLHQMVLTSAVYQQAATFDAAKAEIDPQNRLLWHKPPQRLEAEVLRDALLAAAGTLNLKPYGPAFKPPIPEEAMVARNTKSPYPQDAKDEPATRRRSVYMFHKRVVPYPLLQAFDRPDAQQACGRRDDTTVAPQALALLNDEFVRRRSVEFADRLLAEAGDDDSAAVERVFRTALARAPTGSERTASLEFLQSQIERRQARAPETAAGEIRRHALTDFCQTIFSLNEFLYVD